MKTTMSLLKKQLKKMNKIAVYSLSFGILVIIFVFGWKMASAIWQEPSTPPASNNIAAPISLDDLNEAKAGGLRIDPGGSLDMKNSKLRVVGEMKVSGTSALGMAVAGELEADTNTLTVASNSVGIGTAADPAYKLSVVGGLVRVGSEASPITGPGVYSASSNNIGIQASVNAADKAAVYGENTAASGLSYGVYGKSNAGSAVYGFSSSGKGVYAYTTTTDTTNNIAALAGENTVTAGQYWAGYFKGRLESDNEVLGSKFLPTKLQNSLVAYTAGVKLGTELISTASVDLAFDGTNVWVAMSGASPLVQIFRGSDLKRLADLSFTHGAQAIEFDGTNMWVVTTKPSLVKIDAATRNIIDSYEYWAPGTQLWDVAFDGKFLWTVNYSEAKLTKINPADGSLVGHFPLANAGRCLTFDGQYLWVCRSTAAVSKIDLDGALIATVALSAPPEGLVFDGQYLWVGSQFGGFSVSKIRAESAERVWSGSIAFYPRDLTFDGTYVWVTDWSNKKVIRIVAADPSQQVSFSAGDSATSTVLFDGTYLWLGGSGSTPDLVKLYSGAGWGHTDLSSMVQLQSSTPGTAQNGSFYINGTATFGGVLQITNGDLSVTGNTWGGTQDQEVPIAGDNTYNCNNGYFLKGIQVDAAGILLKLLCRAL